MDIASRRPEQPLALFATTAIISQIILLASALLLPLVSEFRLIGDNISELALGQFGWIQSVAFIIAGAGTLALAYALWQLTTGLWGGRLASLLVAVYGIGALLAAVFPTDRVDSPEDLATLSTTGMIHTGAALISFVCMIIAMFILVRTFRLDPRWRSLSPWIVLLPASALSLLFVQSEGPWVGIMQRLLVGVFSAWIIIVALRIHAIATSGEVSADSN